MRLSEFKTNVEVMQLSSRLGVQLKIQIRPNMPPDLAAIGV